MTFDSIAPHYRWIETVAFGNKLQAARVAFLNQISSPKRALIVGEGNGRFLREFLQKYSASAVDCVDASARMLQLTRKRMRGDSRVRFLHEDLMNWSPEENAYDLIVTHFFLDCFAENEIANLVSRLAGAATARAVWLLADFSIPPRGIAKVHAQFWLRAMYRFFRLTTRINGRELVEPSEYLKRAGFQLVTRELTRFGLIKSDLWQRM